MILHPKTHPRLRAGFSMITAIFVMVLMSLVAMLIMNLAGKTVQETTTQYRKEQAILLAKSYIELAIMAATANNCVAPTITGSALGTPAQTQQGNGYHVDVNIRYIGNNSDCNNISLDGTDTMTHNDSQNAIILIDVFVRYRNPESANAIAAQNWTNNFRGITYHKRTLARL